PPARVATHGQARSTATKAACKGDCPRPACNQAVVRPQGQLPVDMAATYRGSSFGYKQRLHPAYWGCQLRAAVPSDDDRWKGKRVRVFFSLAKG
ncbi:hypothetical protein GW17_00050455, partial [Ensete ventricosum]